MDLRYRSTRATIARWYWESLRRNSRHRRSWLIILACGFVATVVIANEGPGLSGRAVGEGVFVALILAVLLFLYPQLRFKPQERVLRLTKGGISTEINGKMEWFKWADVVSINEGGEELILTFRNLNAFVVPISAFVSTAERSQCVAECRLWLNESRSAPAA
jgi:hypothetical protein